MANQFRSSIGSSPTTPAEATRTTYAKPSNLLTLGALFVPLLFGWFILARPYSPVRKIIYGVLMALSGFWILGGGLEHSGPAGSTASDAAPVTHWTYGSDHDNMRGSDQPYATVDSLDQQQFDFPYNGGSTGTLTIYPAGARLSGEAVSLVVKERLAAIGIDPADYSGHSLRAGFATSAAQAGVSSWKIRQQTGHASEAMLSRYIRDGELFTDNAAGVLL